jgi:hypothetical protein
MQMHKSIGRDSRSTTFPAKIDAKPGLQAQVHADLSPAGAEPADRVAAGATAKSTRNNKPRGRRHAEQERPAIVIAKQLELPNGEVVKATGQDFFLFAPKGTGRAAIDRAVRDFIKDKTAARA